MDPQHELSPPAGVDMPGFAQSPDVGHDEGLGNSETLTARVNLQPESQEDSSAREIEAKISGDLKPHDLSLQFSPITYLTSMFYPQSSHTSTSKTPLGYPNAYAIRSSQYGLSYACLGGRTRTSFATCRRTVLGGDRFACGTMS